MASEGQGTHHGQYGRRLSCIRCCAEWNMHDCPPSPVIDVPNPILMHPTFTLPPKDVSQHTSLLKARHADHATSSIFVKDDKIVVIEDNDQVTKLQTNSKERIFSGGPRTRPLITNSGSSLVCPRFKRRSSQVIYSACSSCTWDSYLHVARPRKLQTPASGVTTELALR